MNGVIEITTWSSFKGILDTRDLRLLYEELSDAYELYAGELVFYHYRVIKGTAEATDFENNYRAGANPQGYPRITLASNDGNKKVTITTDDDKERLDVNAKIDGGVAIVSDESPTKYQLKTNYNTSGTVVTTDDTLLFQFTGQGVIDLVAVNCLTSSGWGVVLMVDYVERLRITMADLGNSLGLTNSDFDIVTETANKQFRWNPTQIGFKERFSIYAYATGANVNLNHLIMFREKTS